MSRARLSAVVLALLAGLAGWLLVGQAGARAQADPPVRLVSGVPAQGSLADRFGEEWVVAGCGGDVLTVTVESSAFAPNLELYPPVGRTPLATTGNTRQRSVELAKVSLPENGEYTLVVLGSTVRDRGAYSMTATIAGLEPLPEGVGLIVPGEPVSGTVSNRAGEEWGFYGCARDRVTLTMQSTGPAQSNSLFPALELFGPTGRSALAQAIGAGNSRTVSITSFALPETGNYTVLAAGRSIRDRGPYSLTFEVETVTEPTPTPTRAGPLCTVVSRGGLNLRSGPGTAYPVTGGFRLNAQLQPLGRDGRGDWIEVQQAGTPLRGWVSAGSQFVSCNVAIRSLPLSPIPPLPPTLTPTPQPTATPTSAAVSGLPQPEGALIQGPGEPGDLKGDIYTARGSLAGFRDGSPVFRSPFFFEMFVFDPAANDGTTGIDHVDFTINCPNGESYTRTERTARYCVFGGGEPTCNRIELKAGDFLPNSQCSIEADQLYSASIEVVPRNGQRRGGFWNFNFFLDLGGR